MEEQLLSRPPVPYQEQYQASIRLTEQKRWELAGLGIRGMENRIRQLIDDEPFDDCKKHYFVF